eukprot:2233084-Rhodomonas_salina.4
MTTLSVSALHTCHTPSQYRTRHSSIRELSTAQGIAEYASSLSTTQGIAAYASSIPHMASQHTLAQHRAPHSSICYLSTAQRTAAYAIAVPRIA